MAKLGTLWFGADIDLTQLKKKIEQGNKDVLNALKIKFDAQSYDKMTSQLRSKLKKEQFEVGIVINQAKVSKAVQAALANAGLSNNATPGMVRSAKISAYQTKEADQHAIAMERLARMHNTASRAANAHGEALVHLNAKLGHGITLSNQLGSVMAGIWGVVQLKQFTTELITIGGEFQKQRIALESMLGSLAKADAMYARMKDLAIESPFTFSDLMSYTKQLSAFQIPYEELYDTTKRLSDISAGLGVDMSRIILAYGQVRSAAFLRGQEVRQFTEAGIPLLDALAKKFTELEGKVVSTGDVFERISKRQVSFQMVKDVLWELTDEGGKFYNMQAKLTDSLSGKLAKLRDTYEITLGDMAQGNNAVLGGLLDTLTLLATRLDTIIGLVGTAGAAWYAYRGAVLLASITINKTTFLNLAAQLKQYTTALLQAAKGVKALDKATKATTFGIIAAAITALVVGIWSISNSSKSAADKIRELSAAFEEENNKMAENDQHAKRLVKNMFDESKAIEEKKAAYVRLQEIYPDMFKNMSYEEAHHRGMVEILKEEARAAKDLAESKAKTYLASVRQQKEEARIALQNNSKEKIYDKLFYGTTFKAARFVLSSEKKRQEMVDEEYNEYLNAYSDAIEAENKAEELLDNIRNQKANADKNRKEKWFNDAKRIAEANNLKDLIPDIYEDYKTYFDKVEKARNDQKGFLAKLQTDSPAYNQTLKDVNALDKLWDAIGGKDKTTGGGGSSEDPLLKAAKARLDALKGFISEYKKLKDTYGENEAVNKAESIFPVFTGKGYDVLKNFRKYFDEILAMPHKAGAEWDKFADSVRKALSDHILDIDKEAIEKAIRLMGKYMDDAIQKYDLFKSLKDKAGKEFAQAAFVDGRVWDDLTMKMADKLKKILGFNSIDWMMDDEKAKSFFDTNKDAYDLWKKIVELTQKNYVDGLNKAADAINEVMRIEEKILKIEQELKELRDKNDGLDHSAEIKKKEQELAKARQTQFEQSEDYVNFYAAPLALARDELERIGEEIRTHLTEQLGRGEISARQYTKAIKDVNDNLKKGREAWGGNGMTFLRGGIPGVMTKVEQGQSMADERVAKATEEVAKAEENLVKARKEGTLLEKIAAHNRVASAKIELDEATKQKAEADRTHAKLAKLSAAFAGIGDVIAILSGALAGLQGIAQELAETFDAFGNENAANKFSDIADGIGAVMSSVDAVSSIVQSAMKGDISGVVSNALMAPFKIFTGPIKAFAQLYDKQIQREIEASKRRQEEMESLTESLERALGRSLSNIYGLKASQANMDALNAAYQRDEKLRNNKIYSQFGKKSYFSEETRDALEAAKETESYYDASYASMLAQKDELLHQMDEEKNKKKSDKDAIADYKKQLEELDDQIQHFAIDLAKSLYDIDLKSWSEELTDAVVDAWDKGEDAIDAYHKKAQDIIKDLTSNVLTQKIMGAAFEAAGLEDLIADLMKGTSGMLDENSIGQIAEALFQVGENSAEAITAILDEMEAKGYIRRGDGSTSNSISGTIKGITENTADLLAAYLNAIRADVAVDRTNISVYFPMFAEILSRSNVIAETQVTLQQQIANNTLRNAEAAETLRDAIYRMENGATSLKVRY